jgi:nickel/cobalt transporter (NiCoT) family protein
MNPSLLIGAVLGMRHGTDPDHLAAIDGLTRIRPRATNGIFFALGHGTVVTLLAVGLGHALAGRLEFLGPWTLILIGAINLYRILRKQPVQADAPARRLLVAQPFLLGMILAAGFETASQLSALILGGRTNPWLLGLVFSIGMAMVDGLDGYLASTTQRNASTGQTNAVSASRFLGLVVVVFSFSLGGAELAGYDIDRYGLPMGLTLFAIVIGIRIWARIPVNAPAGLAE